MLRRARLQDCALLPAIERSAGEVFRRIGMAEVADGVDTPAEFYPPLVDAGTLWVAADASDLPVGFVSCEAMDELLYVHQLAVHADYQQRGLGRALMQTAIESARARRMSGLALRTFRDVRWNGQFYQALGFSEGTPPMLAARMMEYTALEQSQGLDVSRRYTMQLLLG